MARKPAKGPGGRPSEYKPEYCDAVIEHARDGASLTSFAASVGVSRQTITNWTERYPEFLEASARARAICAAWWEAVARNNAMTGGGNSAMTIFGLKNMAAEDWRDKREVDHQSSDGSMTPAPTMIRLVAASDDDC